MSDTDTDYDLDKVLESIIRQMPKECSTCIHFNPGEGMLIQTGTHGYDGEGKCRRYPPQVVYLGSNRVSYVEWPTVHPSDLCGEYAIQLPEVHDAL